MEGGFEGDLTARQSRVKSLFNWFRGKNDRDPNWEELKYLFPYIENEGNRPISLDLTSWSCFRIKGIHTCCVKMKGVYTCNVL